MAATIAGLASLGLEEAAHRAIARDAALRLFPGLGHRMGVVLPDAV
jgi:hypothetical protein